MKDSKLVNCRNYFNEESFTELCNLLESGLTVSIYIDCIGYTRSHYESLRYHKALFDKYGDNLAEITNSGYRDFTYRLKRNGK